MWLRGALVLLTVIVLGLAHAPPAMAAPMTTSLARIRSDATTIVIGTMRAGPDLVVDVDTVVRGTATRGPLTLQPSPDGTAHASGRVLVLVDANGAFRWVGTLVAGSSIETGVIQLAGFFDWNAHFVSPGVMTLAQLKGFLANGSLVQKVVATISVADGTGKFVPSGRSLALEYDAIARKTTLARAPGACLGNIDFRGFDWVRVTLASTCATNERRLELDGELTGIDGNGALTIDVRPSQPFLDKKDFGTFMDDASIAKVKRVLDVTLDDGSKWTWSVGWDGAGLIDPTGTAHATGTMSGQTSTVNGVTSSLQVYDFSGPSITLTPVGGGGTMSTGGHVPSIVTMIDAGTYGSCVFKEPGRPDRTCKLGRGRSKIVRK